MKDPRVLIAMVATSILFVYTLFRTLYYYRSLNYAKKVGHFGYIVSFFLLTTIYTIKYFVVDIRIHFLLAAFILLAPLFLYQFLERRGKKGPS